MPEESNGDIIESAGPASALDALDAFLEEDYTPEDADQTSDGEGPPADDPASDTSDTPDESSDPTDDAADDAPEDDEPDDLKDSLKKLSRTERRKLYEHAEAKAAEKLQTQTAEAERIRAEQDAANARTQEIRQKSGKFIGVEPTTTPDGRDLPAYAELERLIKSRDGYRILDEKYGLSEDEAKSQLEEWDSRREMLAASAQIFDDQSWARLGHLLEQGLKAIDGVNPAEIVKGATGPHDVINRLHASLTTRHQAEVAALRKDFEGRLKAATANGTAVAAKNAARTLPQPETGGRGSAGGSRIYTTSEIDAMTSKEIMANEADLDRAYSEGRIRPG